MSIFSEQPEIPTGLGMALMSNPYAMNNFSAMTNEQKQSVIERTKSIDSKLDMEIFVQSFFSDY